MLMYIIPGACSDDNVPKNSLFFISSQLAIVSKHSSNVLFFPELIRSAKYFLFYINTPFTSYLPIPENAVQNVTIMITKNAIKIPAKRYT